MAGVRGLCLAFVTLVCGCALANVQEAETSLKMADFIESTMFIQLAEDPVDEDSEELEPEGEEQSGGLVRSMNMGVGGYQEIRNFMVAPKKTSEKAEVRSREGCQSICDERADCHSYSYRAGDRRCIWSKEALTYTSRSSFYMKGTKMDDSGQMKPTGKYKQFENLHYSPKGWEKLTADWQGCKRLCDKMDRCGAFTYRNFDSVCQLAGDSVKYDTDFNYYERNMPPPVDPEEEALLSGQELEDKEDLASSADTQAAIKHASLRKASDIMVAKAKEGMKQMKMADKDIQDESNAVVASEDHEAKMRQDMTAGAKEQVAKSKGVAAIEKVNMERGKVKGLRQPDVDEAHAKAKAKIQTAFQEGYMKAQKKHASAYNEQVKEIAAKGKKSADEHSEKITGLAIKMKKEGKEKERKETVSKGIANQELEQESKAKAIMKVKVDSIKKTAAYDLAASTHQEKNKAKMKMIEELRAKRQEREKSRKIEKIQKIAAEKQKKHDKIIWDEKEKKEKVRHESDVKAEERGHVEAARQQKEQGNKEIDKNEGIHKRQEKAVELESKLENAKKGAAELADKHSERQVKVGKCEERRVKGQFLTYAYARSTVFTSAISPGTSFGADNAYNGMLRVQNGLGRNKQSAYLKFSATGNKVVDEEMDLGESKEVSVAISNSVVDNAKMNDIIEKGKAAYVARRRWVDRRRRWSVEPIVSDRRRDPMASRRRELSERRRRSLAALESSVTKASLNVFKFGGPAGKLEVRAVNCNFERPTLTWTASAELSIPESRLRAEVLLSEQEGATANLGSEDVAQAGYWHQDRQDAKELGEEASGDDDLPKLKSEGGSTESKKAPSLPPLPVMQEAKPYIADRRRYVDRRRRFATPADMPGQEQPNEPGPTARRRRFVGQTAGTVYAPEQNNIWLDIKLSANVIGVMRAGNKMCLEVYGGPPTAPIILGSELSTNKPFMKMNIAGQTGARRRRCSQVVALEALQGKPQ